MKIRDSSKTPVDRAQRNFSTLGSLRFEARQLIFHTGRARHPAQFSFCFHHPGVGARVYPADFGFGFDHFGFAGWHRVRYLSTSDAGAGMDGQTAADVASDRP